MKRLLILSSLLLAHAWAMAQTVRIEYDKLSGVVRYSKCQQKSDSITCRRTDKPKLRPGDVVEMKMTNINEFVYRAKTVTRIDKDTTSRNFGAGFGSFLGSTQSLFGNLNFGGFDISGSQNAYSMFGMGGAESMIPDEVERDLIPVRTSQTQVEQGLERIVSEVRTVDATLEQLKALKFDRTKTLARIRHERDSLMRELTVKVPDALKEGYALRTTRDLNDHMMAANRLVGTEHQLLASLKNELVLSVPKRKQEDLDALARAFDGPTLEAHIDEISSVSSELDKARFEYVEMVTLDSEEATALNMDLEIYDQTEMTENTTADGTQPGKVVRYFSDRWITPAGALTDTLCNGCQPLRSAEGFYFGSPLDPAMGTVNNDVYGRSGAYGQWRRWDRNGKLIEQFHIDRPDLAGLVNTQVTSGPAPKLSEKKIFRLPVNRGLILSTSMGVSVATLFEAPKNYEAVWDTAFGYSILLESEKSNLIPVVSSFFHFYWDGEKPVRVGGNIGIGVALAETATLNVLAGPSLIIGRKRTLMLNMGITATQVDRKLDYLPVGEAFESSLAMGAITTKQWGLGYFVGLSFGVGLTGQ